MRPVGVYSDSGSLPQDFSMTIRAYGTNYGVYTYIGDRKTWSRARYNSGPGWQELQKSGALPPRPYSYTRLNFVETLRSCDFEVVNPKDFPTSKPLHKAEGVMGMPRSDDFDNYFGSVNLTVLDNVTKSRFRKKAANVTFDSLTFAGELRETVAMSGKLTFGLASKTIRYHDKLLGLISSGKLGKRLVQVADGVANSWLTYAYGVKPLVKDIENAIDTCYGLGLNHYSPGPTAGNEYRLFQSTVSKMSVPYIGIFGSRVIKRTRLVSLRCGARFDTRMPPYNPSSAQVIGLTWSNVLPAVWELIPYSFLIDYFSNVGDVIQAYSNPTSNLVMGWGVVAVEDTLEQEDTPSYAYPSNNIVSGVGGKAKSTSFRFSRLVSPDTLPSLELNGLSNLSAAKTLNIAGLVQQFASRLSLGKRLLSSFF